MPEARKGAPGFKTYDEVLAEALTLARGVPLNHNLYEVSFGTYADSIGGGHYVAMSVTYSVGTTAKHSPPPAADVERGRTQQIIAAWRRQLLEGGEER